MRSPYTIAEIMGWSRSQVSQYAMLKEIDTQAWHLIATTFADHGSNSADEEVADNATVVASPFGERILRSNNQRAELSEPIFLGKFHIPDNSSL
jgi:hypothetical protein